MVASDAMHIYLRVTEVVSIPFIAGQWSLHAQALVVRLRNIVFQSPSLRGSGRFAKAGAEVAEARCVSIPFIAGQWSLRETSQGGI